ncbi:MAG: DUF2298 domain-containing protein [Candidatus Shapirobacteria bacterium]|nr:DUF2298 domain-containing protein [Candidatus Shapirobacteria bacterium]MDD3002403.1 DUF2298 domain-containing protein [Candidatus Shapirobacteria bacterium]MDD4383289.1 DUF2298 domain-containing protein [Candidatus Shapirobacteria bacterium]
MFSDLTFIIFWWFLIFILGLFCLPLTFTLFKKFWDKGYIFSKTICIAILTYLIFICGVFEILTFTNLNLFLIIFLILFFNFLLLNRKNNFSIFLKTIKENYKTFVFQEIIFILILTTWSFVRGFMSNIEGLEKYMDWGFINSALRSEFLPPQDMWFSGEIINYYYFGHLIFAVLTKLSNIGSAITYNLSIATVCALAFSSTFSIASNLVFLSLKKIDFKKIITAGLISALLLTFGGNLHSVYKIVKINIVDNGKLVLNKEAIAKAVDSYWYPDATRFIGYDPDVKDKTIHEFPIYSFVVADLHGHMNDIPIILFFMAFLLSSSFYSSSLISSLLIIVAGFTLSIAYMTNAWDFAIYGLLFAIFTFFSNLKNDSKTAIKKAFTNGILTIACWFIFSLPFSLKFTPMGEGVKISDTHSFFYQLFILYGGFWLVILPLLLLFLIKKIKKKKLNLQTSDLFVLAIVVTATLLIIIPEIIYLKDIYIYEHRRANTMFKLTYQAFIMYALVSGYAFYKIRLLLKSKWLNFLYGILFAIIFSIHLIYPYFAIRSFYGSLKTYQGLWGLNYLKNDFPDNFNAINWINKNISGQPVMLEAVGDSYTTFNQVSVSTGLPTVEGWIVHEWLWRGGYDKPKMRQDNVQSIYESDDLNRLKQLIQKYNIKYIFIGDKEYEKYPDLNEDNFKKIGGQIIFQSGKTKIYQL